MRWWPIIIQPASTADLIAAQLYTKGREKVSLQDGIDAVSAYPPGRVVHISDGTTMTQADWMVQANADMAVIDGHIAALGSHQ